MLEKTKEKVKNLFNLSLLEKVKENSDEKKSVG
mgnify:CR=1 FL=1